MGMMEKMMDRMMGKMSKEEKEGMMSKMMDKFFADMTVEDKQKMMEEMMPKMMEGVNMMEMMPKMMMNMMGGGEGPGGMMPLMMTEMMPLCLVMMLPKMPKENKIEFVLKMVTSLMEQGGAGMSEEEKKGFVSKVTDKVKA
ncbi:hypothetical protein LCGC14_1226100 [marine sediment metagenome]|jgi:hypothetical protein|uniref:Uncharacterized protein n=1 Tax=marine sediment metagenome TaxID=412755 RepID=A0A0F9NS37_9ZZZZ|nr:hypothetical protein [Candidatus Aminicenantes bacterium]